MKNTMTNETNDQNGPACNTNAQRAESCATDKQSAKPSGSSQECCSDSKSSSQSMKQGQTSCHAHTGKLVSVSGNILTMTDCDGTHEHSHTLATDAKVFCDGVACHAEDLQAGYTIRVTTRPNDMRVATQIESLAKQSEFAQQA